MEALGTNNDATSSCGSEDFAAKIETVGLQGEGFGPKPSWEGRCMALADALSAAQTELQRFSQLRPPGANKVLETSASPWKPGTASNGQHREQLLGQLDIPQLQQAL